ncbi:polyprenyl synthetase family protein [Phenylobacterium sp.]|jgi:geranylgeranyl diphosphate synthase type II|uniref:polyprenyl synthetase family protein n=1 Tax=Phenylobacterium sp. TaxID=1871053 RepID=UPI00378372C9
MEASSSPLVRLQDLRAAVDRALERALPDAGDPPHRIHAAMRYAVLSPGKRLRPLLALLSAGYLGCPTHLALPGACALELVHAASLVLDDLPCMDDATTRRGQPSVHVRYGEEVAVLTGVALLNEAYAMVGSATALPEAARCEMTALLARTVGPGGLIGGQDKDLLGVAELTPVAASQLHHEKTGVLFVAAVEMGALSAGADLPSREALRNFARELGLAFQALDDLEDEDDLARDKPTSNLAVLMGVDGLREEARRRLGRAKAALAEGPRSLSPMGDYVDLLIGRAAA